MRFGIENDLVTVRVDSASKASAAKLALTAKEATELGQRLLDYAAALTRLASEETGHGDQAD